MLPKVNVYIFHEICIYKYVNMCIWSVSVYSIYIRLTLRNLKLGMGYVDKGKAFTVGSCNYKVVLGFIRVFDPSKEKR